MAIYYFRNTGNTSWNLATNWSTTDGGIGDGAIPTIADDAYFTSNSGNCTVATTNGICKTLIFAGVGAGNYSGTFTNNILLEIYGDLKFSPTMTLAGITNIGLRATSTLTSAGLTIPYALLMGSTSNLTYTLADNWLVNAAVSIGNTGTSTINGNQMTINSSLNIGATLATGTTNFILAGTGSFQGTGTIRNNVTINTAGTITIGASGTLNLNYNTGTLTYTAGTVNMFSSSVRLVCNASTTLNTTGIVWPNVTFRSGTITLTSNLSTGELRIDTGAVVINGISRTVYASGNLIINQATSGSASIEVTGTGTWSSTGFNLGNNLIFNNGANTFTISGTVYYASGTMTYTSGTIVTTGSTLVPTNCTLNTTFNWANIYYYGTTTITMASNLNFTGAGNFPVGTITFAGAAYTLTILGTVTVQTTTWWNGQTTLTLAGTNIFGALVRESNFGGGQYWGATINGGSLEVRGNYTVNAGSQGGSTVITLTATGGNITWAGGGGNQVIIDAGTNTVTVPSGLYTGGTITRTSGNVIFSTFNIGNACTIDLKGAYIPTLIHNHNTFNGTNYASTLTFASDLYVGLFDQAAASSALGNTYVINTTGGIMYLNSLKYTPGAFSTDYITTGNGTAVFNGDGYINKASTFAINVTFDNPRTTDIISFPYSTGTMTYKKAKFTRTSVLNISGNATLRGFDKASTLKRATILSTATVTMDQFFNGDSSQQCIISASSTSNYNVQFTDTFERFAKFVDIRNCTLVRPNQLVVTGDHRQKGTNTGIRYTNQSPNGLPKNLSLGNNPMTFGTNSLLGDPNFIRLK